MKAFVSFDPYFKETHTAIYEDNSVLDILKQVINNHGNSINFENLDEDIKEELGEFTTCSLIAYLDEHNGDGCDYVISIIDLENGEIIYNVDEITEDK